MCLLFGRALRDELFDSSDVLLCLGDAVLLACQLAAEFGDGLLEYCFVEVCHLVPPCCGCPFRERCKYMCEELIMSIGISSNVY